jgi:hypothetical protein
MNAMARRGVLMNSEDREDEAADLAAKLTPEEQFLVSHHLNNLYGAGKVASLAGDISTVLQSPVEGPGGRYYNIPHVWNGEVLTTDEATARAAKVGWKKWPSYPTPDQAELRYEMMHGLMERDTERYQKGEGFARGMR